jgi:catechol 2,3-dioxygenase-like lactoylglutathione lyase family enzyme
MLENSKAYSGFAVDDLDKALKFYGDTLGLKTSVLQEGVLIQIDLAGDRPTLVYLKPDFEPASYTILNFPVDDVEAAVDELAAKGVSFESYDGFDQDEKGIDRSGPNGGIAWFKDPAGNILAVHGELEV